VPTPGREAAAPPRPESDLQVPIRRVRGKVRRFSPGVVAIAAMLSVFHLLNYLNYTFLAGYFNPPVTRSALLNAASIAAMILTIEVVIADGND